MVEQIGFIVLLAHIYLLICMCDERFKNIEKLLVELLNERREER
jgi:hypothetical protein